MSPEELAVAPEDFDDFRYKIFKKFTAKIGLFAALANIAICLYDYIAYSSISNLEIAAWAYIMIATAALPLALIWGTRRRYLPSILYFTMGSAFALAVLTEIKGNNDQSNLLWIGFFFLFCLFIFGLPLRRIHNYIGFLVFLIAPNLLILIEPHLKLQILQFNLAIVPMVILILYVQHHINNLVETIFNYQNQIKALADRDPLTGLFNRRRFNESAKLVIKHSRRANHPLSLVIIDIDHFKNINDKFGHPVGDEVIKMTAQAIISTVRETDLVARIGGEEFVALLPETDLEAGLLAAERIRLAIEKSSICIDKSNEILGCTVSLGVSLLNSKDHSVDTILNRADQGLYLAKGHGRNRVETVEPSWPSQT